MKNLVISFLSVLLLSSVMMHASGLSDLVPQPMRDKRLPQVLLETTVSVVTTALEYNCHVISCDEDDSVICKTAFEMVHSYVKRNLDKLTIQEDDTPAVVHHKIITAMILFCENKVGEQAIIDGKAFQKLIHVLTAVKQLFHFDAMTSARHTVFANYDLLNDTYQILSYELPIFFVNDREQQPIFYAHQDSLNCYQERIGDWQSLQSAAAQDLPTVAYSNDETIDNAYFVGTPSSRVDFETMVHDVEHMEKSGGESSSLLWFLLLLGIWYGYDLLKDFLHTLFFQGDDPADLAGSDGLGAQDLASTSESNRSVSAIARGQLVSFLKATYSSGSSHGSLSSDVSPPQEFKDMFNLNPWPDEGDERFGSPSMVMSRSLSSSEDLTASFRREVPASLGLSEQEEMVLWALWSKVSSLQSSN